MKNIYTSKTKNGSVKAIVLLIVFMVVLSSAFVIYAIESNKIVQSDDNTRCCKLTLLKN